jgi:hypothetical protein
VPDSPKARKAFGFFICVKLRTKIGKLDDSRRIPVGPPEKVPQGGIPVDHGGQNPNAIT